RCTCESCSALLCASGGPFAEPGIRSHPLWPLVGRGPAARERREPVPDLLELGEVEIGDRVALSVREDVEDPAPGVDDHRMTPGFELRSRPAGLVCGDDE